MRKYFLITVLLACAACKKYKDNATNPPISHVPKIDLVSTTPLTIHQLSDSIVFTIHYTDGDGDLGFDSADSMSVKLTDNRFPLEFDYHLQPLAPATTTIAITGDLPIVHKHVILKNDSSTSEQATFSIQLRDRAGNWSNTVTTPSVTILH